MGIPRMRRIRVAPIVYALPAACCRELKTKISEQKYIAGCGLPHSRVRHLPVGQPAPDRDVQRREPAAECIV
jgi:hypothetical protein